MPALAQPVDFLGIVGVRPVVGAENVSVRSVGEIEGVTDPFRKKRYPLATSEALSFGREIVPAALIGSLSTTAVSGTSRVFGKLPELDSTSP